MTKTYDLPLSNGMFAIVDRTMAANMLTKSWHLNRQGYPATNMADKKMYLHDWVMQGIKKPGDNVDHINGNKLDNRFENLRLVTKQQNSFNRSANKVRKDTHYKGVILHKGGLWMARVGIDGKKILLGYFKTPEEAAEAYNAGAKEYHGDFAKLNVIEKRGGVL